MGSEIQQVRINTQKTDFCETLEFASFENNISSESSLYNDKGYGVEKAMLLCPELSLL